MLRDNVLTTSSGNFTIFVKIMDIFAEILLPLPLAPTFTYHVPDEMRPKVAIGHRVIVPFGKKRFYTGIVASIITKPP